MEGAAFRAYPQSGNLTKRRMNVKKVISITAVCLLMAFLLTSCGGKTALTSDGFIIKATANDLKVQDNTSQYSEYEHIKTVVTAYVAKDSDIQWKCDFIVAADEENAKGMYESNKEIFQQDNAVGAIENSTSGGNYNTYEREANGKYMYLGRVGHTLLYMNIEEAYEEDAKAFIKAINY